MSKSMRAMTAGFVIAAGLVVFGTSQPASAQRGPPPGSYLETCTRVYIDRGGVMSAQCQTRDGRWRESRLRLGDCGPGDIYNNDGRMGCVPARQWQGRPPPPYGQRPDYGPPPSPGYGQVTVYQDSDFRGEALVLNGDIDNLDRIGFNDRISSMRLGRSRWVMCTDAYFRGTCRTFSGDIRNLDRTGFNDAISSIRRAR